MTRSASHVVPAIACTVAIACATACGGAVDPDFPNPDRAVTASPADGGCDGSTSSSSSSSSSGGSSSSSSGSSSGGTTSSSSSSSGGSSSSSSSSGGTAPPPPPHGTAPGPNGTTIIDPLWERTNEHFLAPFSPRPDLQYYTANTYPLFNEENSPAGASFTWTADAAWNGPADNDYVEGTAPIPGFVDNDTWFYTYDRVNDGITGTTYWFRANVDVGSLASIASIRIEDKFFPGVLAVNDGLVLFVNGVPQPIMHCAQGDAATYLSPGLDADWSTGVATCPLETFYPQTGPGPGWAFVAPDLPLTALHDRTNEIAILFEERNGAGGLDHPVLVVTPATTPGT